MPLPRGVDPDKAAVGYMEALRGYPIEAIAHGIRRFLRGDCENLSHKFCPHPPELADIVRAGINVTRPTSGKRYGYSVPRSRILQRKVTKELGRDLVEQGIHPRGSVWLPGPEEARHLGDIFAPDPYWRGPFLVNQAASNV